MTPTTAPTHPDPAREANEAINRALTGCWDRGDDEGRPRGKGHAFIDYTDRCQCREIDLTKERMR